MPIHISGSVAYDRIMTFPGQFEDYILPEKLHILSVSFLIDRIEEKRGGAAGNIAYSLSLLGEKPLLYTSVGKDFEAYENAFHSLGISTQNLRRLKEDFTACAYITTDKKGNQITGFAPSAMNTPIDPAFFPKVNPTTDWGLVSPGTMDDMRNLPDWYREHKVPFVYDPGQQVIALSGEDHKKALQDAYILIGNDYETEMMCTLTGLNKTDLLQKVRFLIITQGEQGSQILCRDWEKPRQIAAVPCREVVDPTGAGDAYRAGLMKGLAAGLDVEVAAELGATCASFCLEQPGGQEHLFTLQTFAQRYTNCFKTDFPL